MGEDRRGQGILLILLLVIAAVIWKNGGFGFLTPSWLLHAAGILLKILLGMILLMAAAIFLIIRISDQKKKKREEEAARMDTVEGARSGELLLGSLDRWKSDTTLGPIARAAIAQKERLDEHQERYEKLVNRRFQKGSMSYEKYMAVQDQAADTLNNAFLRVVNRMTAFDGKEYRSLTLGTYTKDAIPDEIQEERLKLYRGSLEEMQEILKNNEQVLYELDQLMMKLTDASAEDNGVQEQIAELTQQLKYYTRVPGKQPLPVDTETTHTHTEE